MAGFNNIELITDRPLEVNLQEIYETKKKFPNHAVIASLMVEPKQEKWHEIVKKVEDVGVDGLELEFWMSTWDGRARNGRSLWSSPRVG